MPVHNWALVNAGTFHDLHCSWIVMLKAALNGGPLPAGYYAQAEVSVTAQADEIDEYARLQKTLVIRHTSGDEVVALVEIVSKGNKQARVTLDWFVDKAIGALLQGIHLLIVDLQPPGRNDPHGIRTHIHGSLRDCPQTLAQCHRRAVNSPSVRYSAQKSSPDAATLVLGLRAKIDL